MCQSALPDDLMLLLLKDGGRRQAVRIYQEENDVSLDEAKLAIKNLAQQHKINPSMSGYADLVILGLVLASIMLGALIP